MPLGESDRHKIAVSLQGAGFRSTNAVATMLGIKFACLVVGLAVGMVASTIVFPGGSGWLFGLVGGVLIGVLLNVLPEMILGRLAGNRQRRITAGLAEAFGPADRMS